MPLGDISEQNAVLSPYFGGDTSGIPTSFDVALFTGNPYAGGVEFAYPGYARVTIANNLTTWTVADGASTALASFPDATDAATTDDGTTWVLFPTGSTAISAWEFLDAPVQVDGPGTIEPIGVTVYHPNDTNVPA